MRCAYMYYASLAFLVLSACSGPQVNVLPTDPISRRILEDGTPSTQYSLFTTQSHLAQFSIDVPGALEKVFAREALARGLCAHGYDLVPNSIGYAESGGGVHARFNCRPQ
jgi:hypothetical protein